MAMNKKEQQAFKDLAIELARAKAFKFTDAVDYDVFPPEGSGSLSTGWVFNSYARSVDVACSSCTGHSRGYTDKTTSQGAIKMFSSKKKALMALRNELEIEFSSTLARIDIKIKEE